MRKWKAALGPVVVFLALAVGPGSPAVGQPAGTTPPVPADKSQLRDITGIEQTAKEASQPVWPVAVGIGLALVFLLALVFHKRLFGSRETPAVSPQVWATAEFDRLAALAPDGADQAEHFHTLLAGVLRTYVEMRFQLPACRQTTPEFLNAVKESDVVTAEHQALLRTFLSRCDLAKFARAPFSRDECLLAVRLGREFVDRTTAAGPNGAPD